MFNINFIKTYQYYYYNSTTPFKLAAHNIYTCILSSRRCNKNIGRISQTRCHRSKGNTVELNRLVCAQTTLSQDRNFRCRHRCSLQRRRFCISKPTNSRNMRNRRGVCKCNLCKLASPWQRDA
ncbi:hypothetical protein [Lambdina fiscellaria nucleopolyhedrovirus]|uniref:Uncharacterized protein n=1 Tax=Lambdina fiscellaria nucleopolyhedrovirus TaxID=1642929 RepID=A0A0E3Z5Z5_9ABAC|nr:hypothetical protein [Lambdina fiscellaria nucleopolyhedrovirus]AKC91657.1 hypothetical protein [Lambdina fiscellaria nucleopolyhedrovirus]